MAAPELSQAKLPPALALPPLDGRFPWLYLGAVLVAEVVANLIEARLGLLIHGALLVALILHSSFARSVPMQRFLLTLITAPMIRILSFGLPLDRFDQMYWYLIVSLPLFLASYLIARNLGYTWGEVGFKVEKPLWQFGVVFSGVPIGIIEYLILRPERLVFPFSWPLIVLAGLILLICTGVLEEVVFRGIIQRAALEVMPRLHALIFTAALFAVLHIGYQSVFDVVMVFTVGMLWGWVMLRTGSLLGISIAHGMTNIILFLVMPYLMG